jgi:hypothetical protein
VTAGASQAVGNPATHKLVVGQDDAGPSRCRLCSSSKADERSGKNSRRGRLKKKKNIMETGRRTTRTKYNQVAKTGKLHMGYPLESTLSVRPQNHCPFIFGIQTALIHVLPDND